MTAAISTIIFPVKDLPRAKALFSKLTGVAPYMDEPYYVGFRLDGQEIGLDPHGHSDGMTAYWHVEDINDSLAALLDTGATTLQEVKDVGAGRLTASVTDPDGNIVGLLQRSS
jgi:predicted enzyme related to lactoylglutathione lyase